MGSDAKLYDSGMRALRKLGIESKFNTLVTIFGKILTNYVYVLDCMNITAEKILANGVPSLTGIRDKLTIVNDGNTYYFYREDAPIINLLGWRMGIFKMTFPYKMMSTDHRVYLHISFILPGFELAPEYLYKELQYNPLIHISINGSRDISATKYGAIRFESKIDMNKLSEYVDSFNSRLSIL